MIPKDMKDDDKLIPWYEGTINLTMTPLDDTKITMSLGIKEDFNLTKDKTASLNVSRSNYIFKV